MPTDLTETSEFTTPVAVPEPGAKVDRDAWGTILNTAIQALVNRTKFLNNNKSATGHTHDDRYYTEAEVDDLIAAAIPTGMIALWSGTVATIPSGWALCDGQNGTPDLRERFVMGAGTTAPGSTGGASSKTTSEGGAHGHTASTGAAGGHSHAITVNNHTLSTSQIPSHSHSGVPFEFNDFDRGGSSSKFGLDENASSTNNTGSSGSHNHSASSDTVADHSHSVTVNSGGAHTHSISDIRPAYYALAYIMKV